MGKCDLCKDGVDKEVQAFTLENPETTMVLCRVHYDFTQKNNRVTGKLVVTRCKACHQPTGYEWVKYKAPGRKRKGAKGNTKLDEFFDMRSKIERELGTKKAVRKKKNEDDAVDIMHDTIIQSVEGAEEALADKEMELRENEHPTKVS